VPRLPDPNCEPAARKAFERLSSRVHRFEGDSCCVYAITSGDRALLIDFGSGAALHALEELGVRHVDWVLLTHHHRDQCFGLADVQTKVSVAVPASEHSSFAGVESFWQRAPVFDLYDCVGMHNVVATNLRVDRVLEDYERLEWQDLCITVYPTPGHTRGSVSYVAEVDGLRFAFTGDLIHSAGAVTTIHDLSWWYGDAAGFKCAVASSALLREIAPDRIAPSHGDVIAEPDSALAELESNLLRHIRCVDRSFGRPPRPDEFAEGSFRQLTDRLVAVTHTCANFYVLLGPDGDALFFDYGFAGEHHFNANFRFVEHSLGTLRRRFGVERPSVVVPTHYHDDHVAGIAHLQERFGAEVWAFDGFAEIIESPARFRLPCLWPEPVAISRRIATGETIEWNGVRLTAHRAPGHTWYAAAYLGEIDGRRVAVTGDAVSQNAVGEVWGGGPVYRNRLAVGDFAATAGLLLDYSPELVLTGHRGALEVSRDDLSRFGDWARELDESLLALAADPEAPGLALDPDVVSVLPYQACGRPGKTVDVEVEVRNHLPRVALARVHLDLPRGWTASPDDREAKIAAGESWRAGFSVAAPRSAACGIRHVIFASATLGGRELGPAAECLVVLE
jgi:glyoxylase-like metal-dependent hydrolase (beta-lactamase superfamily II)